MDYITARELRRGGANSPCRAASIGRRVGLLLLTPGGRLSNSRGIIRGAIRTYVYNRIVSRAGRRRLGQCVLTGRDGRHRSRPYGAWLLVHRTAA